MDSRRRTLSIAPPSAAAAPGAHRWYQSYLLKDRDATLDLVRRAVAAGEQVLDRPPIADHATLFLRGGFSMPGARYTTLTLPTPPCGGTPNPQASGGGEELGEKLSHPS